MNVTKLFEEINKLGIDFYTGVPDSQLKAFIDTLMINEGIGAKHVVAANEGAACGLAAGHYLATGNPAVVYMQNSGIGNAINPICSLLNDKVYAIPALFIIGWRGEPGVHDEPQHVFQGEITTKLLDVLDIKHFVITKETVELELEDFFATVKSEFEKGHQCAIVVKKGALKTDAKPEYKNDNPMSREHIVNLIVDNTKEDDIFVSTTGKLSRELFEAREARHQGHKKDFLTVGSMGHSSMIAMGIAREKKDRRVFCLDGDGAVLMHMGSLAVAGSDNLSNYVHLLVNNGSHETVGGLPTVSEKIDYLKIAEACGYKNIYTATTEQEFINVMQNLDATSGNCFIEVKSDISSRSDLGRPTTTPIENKNAFMEFLK